MENIKKIIGLCGSLRKGPYNAMLLRVAGAQIPEGIDFEIISIEGLPVYNEDLDMPHAPERPESVTKFREALEHADAFIIASPEYNYSIPGGLKNAIDWASRGKGSPMMHKPVAIMGATQSQWGTIRMQAAFLPVLTYLNMNPVLQPEVLIALAQNKFDAEGKLTDETAINLIKKKVENLISACRV